MAAVIHKAPIGPSYPNRQATAGSIPAMTRAHAIAARGGAVVSAGLLASGATFSYLHTALVSDGKTIMGRYMGSCVPKRDLPRFIALYRRGMSPVHKLLAEPEKKSNWKMNALSNHSATSRGFGEAGIHFQTLGTYCI